jgi:hypothetical protein
MRCQHAEYAMCLVFAVSEDLDGPSKDLLSRAYEAACDELQFDHQLSPEAFGNSVEAMTTALLDLYHAGQRDEGSSPVMQYREPSL